MKISKSFTLADIGCNLKMHISSDKIISRTEFNQQQFDETMDTHNAVMRKLGIDDDIYYIYMDDELVVVSPTTPLSVKCWLPTHLPLRTLIALGVCKDDIILP